MKDLESNMSRKLTINIMRCNPQNPADKPSVETFLVDETPGLSFFLLLKHIKENMEPDLSYDFVCRAGICGSCAMVINGKPRLACKTLTNNFEETTFTLAPLPGFPIIKDLSVNTGAWMRAMNKRVRAWVHTNIESDISKMESKVDPDIAQEVFELDRCIECGICVASCGTKLMRPDFVGAVGLNKVARFSLDSLDQRTDEDFYELIGDENGVFGCMSLLGCEDNCPKSIPLQSKIAYLRQKMVELRK